MSEVKATVISTVRAASQDLGKAYNAAVASNPLAADVPCVKKLMEHSQQLNMLITEINKLRF